ATLTDSIPAGTLPYMAPEQLFMDADHRTDLWAVGAILYEMLAGRRPYDAADPDALLDALMKLDEPVPPLGRAVAGVPPAPHRGLERCLAKRKANRFRSAGELLDELEALLPRRYGRALADDESPFPGLDAFQEADADRFFGRAQDVARAVARLRRQPILGVVGASGVGESSVVRAGSVPALKASEERWEALSLRPGRRPLASLVSILDAVASVDEPGLLGETLRRRARATGCRILLVVDQLEELYT